MERVVDGQPLYEADISTGLECGQPPDGGPAIVTAQVHADLTLPLDVDTGHGFSLKQHQGHTLAMVFR